MNDKVKTAARQADDDAIEAMFRPRAGVIFNFEEGQRQAEIRVGEARFELMLGGLVERRRTSDNQGSGRQVGEPSVDEGKGRPEKTRSTAVCVLTRAVADRLWIFVRREWTVKVPGANSV